MKHPKKQNPWAAGNVTDVRCPKGPKALIFCNIFVLQARNSEIKAEITFTAFQQNFTLDLYQNRGLFTSRYLERHNDSATDRRTMNHCFYHGTVRGRERSTVSLSTCEGIEGLIFDGLTSYYLEPTDNSFHLIYRMNDYDFNEYYSTEQRATQEEGVRTTNSQRQLSKRSIANLKTHKRTRRDVFTETKYVELLIVNDHKQFEACGKNLTKTNLRAKQIANIVDAIFKPLNVRVALVAIETWDVADRVKADDDAETYLSNLIKYRKKKLLRKYPNDVTKLLTGVSLRDSIRGKAQVMTICSRQSAGVIQDYSRNAAFTANTFAHELGHVFGMYHDEDLPRCVCKTRNSRGCVMSEHVGREPATEFSNCSLKGLEETLSRGLGSCLLNVPRTLVGGPVCGDGIVGGAEECDCGTAQECADKRDTCCDHVTCKLRAHAQCADGTCCEKCRFKKSGTTCREKVNECDIPEACTGSSGICPQDVYVHNGYPCANNTAYCYLGECLTHDQQCQDLWGHDAVSGPDMCYNYHNTRSPDKFGHCRKSKKGKYRACQLQDAKCGKLWCLARNQRPILGIQRDVMNSRWPIDGKVITCKGTNLQMGVDVPEAAMTLEGTKCGDQKVCLNRQCVSVNVLLKKVPECAKNCSGNGLCSNAGKCHCFEPWTGVSCGEKIGDVKPTSKASEPIKTLFYSTTRTHLSTKKPSTTAQTTPIRTLTPTTVQGVESKVVYSAVSASLVALIVLLVAGLCSYKRHYKHQKFVVQNTRKTRKIRSRVKVIVI